MTLSNTATPRYYGEFRQQVLNGEIPVNKEVSLEMNRIDFLIDSPDYYYDSEAIEGFVKFCENELTLTDGSPLKLLPSFKLWAESLLAWFYYRDEKYYNQHTRQYEIRTVKRRLVSKQFLIVGRGAAKSMYDACIQAYSLILDKSTTHQVVTAPTMKQANETLGPIQTAMSRARGPLLSFMTDGSVQSNSWSKVALASTKKGIENFLTNSIIEIRPMSVDKLQGLRTKVNVVDEWLSGHVKEDVIGALEQGASKIDDYIIIASSSEGTDRDGVGDTVKMELEDILHGNVFNPHYSIWYYKLDDVREVNEPELWLKANPNLGATVTYDAYQREVDEAEAAPAKRNDMLAKRFGIPVEGYTYYFVYEETLPTRAKQNYNGMNCVMGADLSQGDDFCAFTLLFPLSNNKFGIKVRSYVSDSKVKKLTSAMQIKYQEFVKEGSLVIMDKPTLDMKDVYEDLQKYLDDHDYVVDALGYDPYNAYEFLESWKMYNGPYGIEKVRQGARTESVPMGDIKNLAQANSLIFDESLMSFSMGNAVAIEDNNGNLKLSKKRSDEKIDNVAALIDAWVAYNRNKEAFM